MNWLRRIFGRRPVDIAYRELRKAERQLLAVEFDLEMHLAARDYLQRRIERLELYIKTDGLDRTEFSRSAERMGMRICGVNPQPNYPKPTPPSAPPYRDPLSTAVKAFANFGKSFVKPSTGNKNAI